MDPVLIEIQVMGCCASRAPWLFLLQEEVFVQDEANETQQMWLMILQEEFFVHDVRYVVNVRRVITKDSAVFSSSYP